MADRKPEKKPAPAAPKSPSKVRTGLRVALLVAVVLGAPFAGQAIGHWWFLHGKAVKSWVKHHVPHKKAQKAPSCPAPAPKAETPAPEAPVPAPAPQALPAKPERPVLMMPAVGPDHGKKFDVLMDSQFDRASVEDWEAQAWKAAKDHKRVLVRISSPGGSAFAMLKLIQNLQDLKKATGAKLVCYGDIVVASAAAVTFEAVCDERYVTPATLVLFHEAQVDGVGGSNEAQGQDNLTLLHNLNLMVDQYIANRLGMTLEQYRAKVFGRDWWVSPEELVQLHGADAVVDPMETPYAVPEAPKPESSEGAAP